jgi:hypothetical protein
MKGRHKSKLVEFVIDYRPVVMVVDSETRDPNNWPFVKYI